MDGWDCAFTNLFSEARRAGEAIKIYLKSRPLAQYKTV